MNSFKIDRLQNMIDAAKNVGADDLIIHIDGHYLVADLGSELESGRIIVVGEPARISKTVLWINGGD